MSTLPFAPWRRAGDWISFSGLIGMENGRPADGLDRQVKVIFSTLDERLHSAGAQRSDIVKCTLWLKDLENWATVNDHYAEYFTGPELPTRSTVGAQLLPGYLLELEVWAYQKPLAR